MYNVNLEKKTLQNNTVVIKYPKIIHFCIKEHCFTKLNLVS